MSSSGQPEIHYTGLSADQRLSTALSDEQGTFKVDYELPPSHLLFPMESSTNPPLPDHDGEPTFTAVPIPHGRPP